MINLKHCKWKKLFGSAFLGLSLFTLFIMSCASSESVFLENEESRPNWDEKVEEEGLGKADFTKDELVNLDYWPYIENKEEVTGKVLNTKNPVLVNTCSRFLSKQEAGYEIKVEFLLNDAGEKEFIHFINEVGPCDDLFEDVTKDLKIRPGVRDNRYVRTYVIFGFRTNYLNKPPLPVIDSNIP